MLKTLWRAFVDVLIDNDEKVASCKKQNLHPRCAWVIFCELKPFGSNSIVIRLIQQVWLRYTARKGSVSLKEVYRLVLLRFDFDKISN